jgi:hypothetical protein
MEKPTDSGSFGKRIGQTRKEAIMKLRLSLAAATLFALIGLALATFSSSAAVATSTSPVFWFQDPAQRTGQVPGAWSTLIRNDAGVEANYHATGLTVGHAYTLWWVIFNNPRACSSTGGGCSPDDVEAVIMSGGERNPAGIGILYATGGVVVTLGGVIDFEAELGLNDDSGCVAVAPFDVVCRSLTNPMGAEVHLMPHDHGPPIPGQIVEQLTSFEGGCLRLIDGNTGATMVEYGLGPYRCFTQQGSPHLP